MHRLNSTPYSLTLIIPFQALIRAAVIDTDAQGGESAALALDDMLTRQPDDVRAACINLGFSLLARHWFDNLTLEQAAAVCEAALHHAPKNRLAWQQAQAYCAANRAIGQYTLCKPNDQQIRTYLRLREFGASAEVAAREVMAR